MGRLRAIALCLGFSVAALAQTHPCTQEDSQRADQAVDTLNSWNRVYDWYKKYRQCDDGAPAEGVSEAVARNLVDRWGTLPRLAELAKGDAGFRRFVLKHLDETLNEDDLKKISANAVSRCPANLHSLCRELKMQAETP
jgi:hypothetical protein